MDLYDDSWSPVFPNKLARVQFWRACWRNPLGLVLMLGFVCCLTLVSIGPTRPNQLGVTLLVGTFICYLSLSKIVSEIHGEIASLRDLSKICFNSKKQSVQLRYGLSINKPYLYKPQHWVESNRVDLGLSGKEAEDIPPNNYLNENASARMLVWCGCICRQGNSWQGNTWFGMAMRKALLRGCYDQLILKYIQH